jgi:CRP-like cAMP-binding protein
VAQKGLAYMGTSSILQPIPTLEYRRADGFPRGIKFNEQEAALITASVGRPMTLNPGHELAVSGMPLSRPKYILSGWVGLTRILDDGRCQIVDLHVAGELTVFDLQSRTKAKASYVAITSVDVVEMDGLVEKVVAQPDLFPCLATLLRSAADEAHSRLIEQVVRVGRMLAHERVAHLTLDLYRRFNRMGLCSERSFPMPLTQETLADVLGLSTVHINRTLQLLRQNGMLKTGGGRWEIADMEQLKEVASGARPRNI